MESIFSQPSDLYRRVMYFVALETSLGLSGNRKNMFCMPKLAMWISLFKRSETSAIEVTGLTELFHHGFMLVQGQSLDRWLPIAVSRRVQFTKQRSTVLFYLTPVISLKFWLCPDGFFLI